ncbi:MAG: ABC transporter permease subunit [Flavobacterium sp.]|nr:ABC transporter permease subunit [Flavobacterium sp.]
MKALLLREIKSFFGSPIGYLVIAIFLLLNGLFLWVFEGEFNILNSGFADMGPFFKLAPWILIFLIPAVTMRSFSDEKKQGTIELLFTKPLSNWDIVNGKFLGAFILIVLAIVPTIIYVLTISHFSAEAESKGNFIAIYLYLAIGIIFYLLKFILKERFLPIKKSIVENFDIFYMVLGLIVLFYSISTIENIDMGSTLGSYFGLLFLIAAYTAIGVFSSTLSDNQIVAFIIAVFCCFIFYFGFEGFSSVKFFTSIDKQIANLGFEFLNDFSFFKYFDIFFEYLGMDFHFKSMSRGVLDTRDIVYFVSVTVLFLSATVYQLKSLKW